MPFTLEQIAERLEHAEGKKNPTVVLVETYEATKRLVAEVLDLRKELRSMKREQHAGGQ